MQATIPDLQTALTKIQDYESYYAMSQWPGGWTADLVGIDPLYLPALEEASVIVPVKDENGRMEAVPRELATGYRLSSFGITFRFPSGAADLKVSRSIEPPEDLFDSIVGYDDVKELLLASLRAPKPVHLLLVGPPTLAKSLFLWEIEQAYAADALWLLGSAASQPGLWDLIAERRPQVLLLDEFEKMRAVDQAALLSLMEGGRLVRAKVGRHLDLTVECRVFATANSMRSLTPEVLSRFARRVLQPYQREEFLQVVAAVLTGKEGLPGETARDIARRLAGRTQDVRDAIRVARIAQQVGVDRAVELLDIG